MDKTNLSEIIEKYVNGSATDEERQELLDWYRSFDHELVEWPIETGQENDKEEILNRVLSTLKSKYFIEKKTNKRFFQKRGFAYAAISLFVLGITLFFYLSSNSSKNIEVWVENHSPNDILPGSNKATLTLSDGAVIDLGDLESEKILLGDGTTVLRNENGELIYADPDSQKGLKANRKVLYNTMVTPKGGQYQVLLADGSRVWLNAESSLYFPTEFVGKNRKVVLTGEAYFEVAKNKDMPFIVSMDNMEIEVLGTQFNVKAYADENKISTTLVEGAVRINSGAAPVLLTPGEQADFDRKDSEIRVATTDIQARTAWKNGYFIFDNEDIKSIMLNLSRWYDVDVEYRGDMINKEFTGRILRRSNISDVLRMLELTGTIKFQIEGRRIIVMP